MATTAVTTRGRLLGVEASRQALSPKLSNLASGPLFAKPKPLDSTRILGVQTSLEPESQASPARGRAPSPGRDRRRGSRSGGGIVPVHRLSPPTTPKVVGRDSGLSTNSSAHQPTSQRGRRVEVPKSTTLSERTSATPIVSANARRPLDPSRVMRADDSESCTSFQASPRRDGKCLSDRLSENRQTFEVPRERIRGAAETFVGGGLTTLQRGANTPPQFTGFASCRDADFVRGATGPMLRTADRLGLSPARVVHKESNRYPRGASPRQRSVDHTADSVGRGRQSRVPPAPWACPVAQPRDRAQVVPSQMVSPPSWEALPTTDISAVTGAPEPLAEPLEYEPLPTTYGNIKAMLAAANEDHQNTEKSSTNVP